MIGSRNENRKLILLSVLESESDVYAFASPIVLDHRGRSRQPDKISLKQLCLHILALFTSRLATVRAWSCLVFGVDQM